MNKSMMHTYENNTPQAWDDIRNHEALFESFASMYLREHPGDMLRLKREHTYKVLAHARAIVAQEGLASQEGRAALLAALYHDTGRFPQYIRWRTFSDAESENHGYLGVHVVKNFNRQRARGIVGHGCIDLSHDYIAGLCIRF